jgi:hypothetical protein
MAFIRAGEVFTIRLLIFYGSIGVSCSLVLWNPLGLQVAALSLVVHGILVWVAVLIVAFVIMIPVWACRLLNGHHPEKPDSVQHAGTLSDPWIDGP